MAREISQAEHLIRELYAITTDHADGFGYQLANLLRLGCERLGLEIGIVSRVEGDEYHVVQAQAPQAAIVAGDKFLLGHTYCERTLRADGPVGFAHASAGEMKSHPCYAEFGLEAYLGTPVRTPGGVFGTLNFSSATPRAREFDEVDIDAVQLMATWVGSELARRELAERVARIEALIPICASCKLIRTELGDWQRLEEYFGQRAEVRFSHGVCPDCLARMG